MPGRLGDVETTVALDVAGPFDGPSQLAFLGRRAVPGIEQASRTSYARTVRLPSGPALLRLHLSGAGVRASVRLADLADLPFLVALCRRLLDLDADSTGIDRHLGADPLLARSVRDHPGLRVPGAVDGFETAVRAVVGQQVSVSAARTILSRLTAEHGERLDSQGGLTMLFPTPFALARLDADRLPMPRARGRALVALASAVAAGEVVLDRRRDLEEVRRSLLAMPGIGPWTADYVALRALGAPDVFLAGDLGVRQGLARLGVRGDARAVAEGWRPWRSYALMHVWKALEASAT